MKYLNNLDLQQNQLIKATVQNIASLDGVSGVDGQIIFNTTDKLLYVYKLGTGWEAVGGVLSVDGQTGDVDLSGVYQPLDANIVSDPNYAHITVTSTSVSDGTNTFNKYVLPSTTLDSSDIGVTVQGYDANTVVDASYVHTDNNYTNTDAAKVAHITVTTDVDLDDISGNSHTQNTDTGTDSATFQLDSGNSGVKIKNAAGELQVRNAWDTDYANLRVKDLYVEGTTTTINSNEVTIGDSNILLNADITDNAANSDGGISIKLLKSDDTTENNAEMYYSVSNGRWVQKFGDVEATLISATVAAKLSAVIGDNSNTAFVVTHNLNSRDLIVNIRETAADYELVQADVEFTSLDTITVRFAVAPTLNQYTVTIIG